MRISDWSSDVCSSDLKVERKLKKFFPTVVSPGLLFREDDLSRSRAFEWLIVNQLRAEFFWRDPYKNEVDIVLGEKKPVQVEDRKSVVKGKSVSVRVDRGGRGIDKKKQKKLTHK